MIFIIKKYGTKEFINVFTVFLSIFTSLSRNSSKYILTTILAETNNKNLPIFTRSDSAALQTIKVKWSAVTYKATGL
jgi:hypothetical protein